MSAERGTGRPESQPRPRPVGPKFSLTAEPHLGPSCPELPRNQPDRPEGAPVRLAPGQPAQRQSHPCRTIVGAPRHPAPPIRSRRGSPSIRWWRCSTLVARVAETESSSRHHPGCQAGCGGRTGFRRQQAPLTRIQVAGDGNSTAQRCSRQIVRAAQSRASQFRPRPRSTSIRGSQGGSGPPGLSVAQILERNSKTASSNASG